MSAFPVSRSRRFHGALGKRLAVLSLAGILVASALAPLDAEAKRMGGSRSFGRQTQMAPSPTPSPSPSSPSTAGAQRAQQAQPAQQNAAPAAGAPAAAAAQPRNRWLGPLAGIAAGLGIGALLSHFGLGEGLAQMLSSLLLIGLVVFAGLALFRFFARKRRPDLAYSHGQAGSPRNGDFARAAQQAPAQHASTQPSSIPQSSNAASQSSYGGYSGTQGFSVPGAASSASPGSLRTAVESGHVPAGFDTDGFLRTSKVTFVRLQAAWDKGDQGDIYEFTTPEMFAEIKMDLEARGKQTNRTDVVELDAQLLGVEELGSEQLASVRFHGLIRENEGESAQPFNEAWNLIRDARRDSAWRLAGIQQIA